MCRDEKTAIAVHLLFNCSFSPTHIPVPHTWMVRGMWIGMRKLQLQFLCVKDAETAIAVILIFNCSFQLQSAGLF